VPVAICVRFGVLKAVILKQWRTKGWFGGVHTPPHRNSEDIGGVLDHMSKKNRRLDFLLQFTVFSHGCNLLNKRFLLIQTVLQWRIWFRSSNPPPTSRKFEKVEPDCKLSGKYLGFLFHHPNWFKNC